MSLADFKLVCLLYYLPFGVCASEVTIIDARHYSEVFGEIRNYRVFLPPDYFEQPDKSYPVIYYYHGWSQRYFGNTNHNSIGVEKGNDNQGDNIENFVSSHDVIVVKPDGYNRGSNDDYYLRPYNIGPVENDRQFPLYFPELVDHIDAKYRTIADRNHRAISGLSMGGFMTFWIAGKFPHLVSAAGNFCGSTEFFVGPRNAPVEYRHIDMHKNYQGLNVRLHYGNEDFIRGYHQDMNKIWTQVMDNYDYKIFEAAHSTCGLGEMYEFILDTFENPPPLPDQWHHIDVYPGFRVWDYQIQSDRTLPGFTVLENVDARGFRCAVREFVPDGSLMPHVQLTVVTAPIYKPNQPYVINNLALSGSAKEQREIYSDDQGRLMISLDGGHHEIGINEAKHLPNVRLASYELRDAHWAIQDQDVQLSVSLLNKGNAIAQGLTAQLLPLRNTTQVKQASIRLDGLAIGEITELKESFVFRVQTEKDIAVAQFKLVIRDERGSEWVDVFEIPIKPAVPTIENFEIADGRQFNVAAAGDDSVSVFLGSGNGDGLANPGESLVILVKDQGIYRRTFLSTNDTLVNPKGFHIRESDYWGSYDHVGGSAKYSIPVIASHGPANQKLTFHAEYWLPDYPYHIIKQGVINLEVTGQDQTPPGVQWAQTTADNVIQVKVIDGGEIQSVKAKLINQKHPEQVLEINLTDDGSQGDRAIGDQVFSRKIQEQKFGLYSLEIEATDAFGNTMTTDWPGNIVLY